MIRKVLGSISSEVNGFFTLPNPLSSTMALEMSPMNLLQDGSEVKGQQALKAHNLTAICEPFA
jgi:hypothetical protein